MKRILSLAWAVLVLSLPGVGKAWADLSNALDNPGKTFAKSTHPFVPVEWGEDFTTSRSGPSSARSGPTPDNLNAAFLTTVSGPGTLSFWWKVSCEPGFDRLVFLVDGEVRGEITGERDWTQLAHTLPEGSHELEWRYGKDGSDAAGADAGWVDGIVFTPPGGDADRHLDARVRQFFFGGRAMIADPASPQSQFTASAIVDLQRLDEVAAAPAVEAAPVRIDWEIWDITGAPAGVDGGTHEYSVPLATHQGGGPAGAALNETFTVGVSNPAAIQPDHTYELRWKARLFYNEVGEVSAGEGTVGPVKLMAFSGELAAGGVSARFDRIGFAPGTITPVAGGFLVTMDSPPESVWLTARPETRFRLNSVDLLYRPDTQRLEVPPGNTVPLPDLTAGALSWKSSRLTGWGAEGVPTLTLPRGLGWTPSAHASNGAPLIPAHPLEAPLRRRLTAPAPVAMDNTLGVAGGTLNFATGEPLWTALEGRPLWFRVSQFFWSAGDDEIRFEPDEVRPARMAATHSLNQAAADGLLENPADDTSWAKKSNDDYFLAAQGTHSPVRVGRDAGGRALARELDLMLAPGAFTAHFPIGLRAKWSAQGRHLTVEGAVDEAASVLPLPDPVTVLYAREDILPASAGPACASGAGPGGIRVRVDEAPGAAWSFTADGGLRSSGAVTRGNSADPAPLEWGALTPATFAFSTSSFASGTVVIAGHRAQGAGEDAAASLLLSGQGGSGPERPGTDGYEEGGGDYPGLNLRAASGEQGTHRLAGHPVPVGGPLTTRSKYLVRPGGVSGIHEVGQFDGDLLLFGFRTRLQALKLSFLDGAVEESRTRGSLVVPPPGQPEAAGFELPFTELRFTSRGGLESARLGSVPAFRLPYWNVPVRPLALSFETLRTAGGCGTDDGHLLLAVDARIPALTTARLRGTLGFAPDGTLATGGGADATFALPPSLTIHGPSGGDDAPATAYRFEPVTRASLSAYDPAIPEGFVSVAGTLHSESLPGARVHVHARAALPGQPEVWSTRPGDVPLSAQAGGVWIMGGWPMHPDEPNQYGWSENGKHFFNNANFDPGHRGFPSGVSLTDYRRPADPADRRYRVRGETSLLDVVDFDYSLQWNPRLRSFASSAPETSNLIFLETEHRVKRMTPIQTDIDFGISPAGDPVASLNGMLDDFKHERNALFAQVSAGVRQGLPTSGAGLLDKVLRGLDSVDLLLNDRLDAILDAPVDALVDGPVGDVAAQLAFAAQQAPEQFRANVRRTLRQTGNGEVLPALKNATGDLNTSLTRLGEATAATDEFVDGVARAVADLQDAVSSAMRIMGTPPRPYDTADRRVVSEVFRAVAKATKAPDQQLYEVLAGPALNAADLSIQQYLPEAEEAFRKIDRVLRELETTLADLQRDLKLGREFLDDIQGVISEALGLTNGTVFAEILGDLDALAAAAPVPAAEFGSGAAVRAALKTRLKEVIKKRLRGSLLTPQLQAVFRTRLADPREKLTGAVDLLLAKVEEAIRRFALPKNLTEPLDTLDRISELTEINKVVGAAGLKGSASFNGPSIRHLRLDADLTLKLPDELKFRGWFVFDDYGRRGPAKGCIPAGVMAASVTLGAAGEAALAGKSVSVTEEGYFSLASGGPTGFYPIAFFGDASLAGSLKAGAMDLNELRGQIGIGIDPSNGGSLADAYFAAKGKARVEFIDGEVAFFAGRTCRLGDLETLDPDVIRVLGNAAEKGGLAPVNNPGQPFNGFYINFGGEVNISRFYNIPRALVDLSGTRREGYFGFIHELGGGRFEVKGGARYEFSMRGQLLSSVSLGVNANALAYATVPLGSDSLIRDLLGASLCLQADATFEACLVEPLCKDFTLRFDGELRPRAPWLALQLDLPLPGLGRFSFPAGYSSPCFR